MTFCASCGAANKENANFCAICGKPNHVNQIPMASAPFMEVKMVPTVKPEI